MLASIILGLSAVVLTGIPTTQGWFQPQNHKPLHPSRPPHQLANPWAPINSNQPTWGGAPAPSTWGAGPAQNSWGAGQPQPKPGPQPSANQSPNQASNRWSQPSRGGWSQQNQQPSQQNQSKQWPPKPADQWPRPAQQNDWRSPPASKPGQPSKSPTPINPWNAPKPNPPAPRPGHGSTVSSYWPRPLSAMQYQGAYYPGGSIPDPPDLPDVPWGGAPASSGPGWNGAQNPGNTFAPGQTGGFHGGAPGPQLSGQEAIFARQRGQVCQPNPSYLGWCQLQGDGRRRFRLMDAVQLIPQLPKVPQCFRGLPRANCASIDNVMVLWQQDFCRCKNHPLAECVLNDCGSTCSFEFYQNKRRLLCE